MGGFGSGYYGSNPGKMTVEQCCSIDIRRWQRDNLLSGSFFGWSWFNGKGETKASIGVKPKEDRLILSYQANDEPVEINVSYDETQTGFGTRKWFVCPSCGGRCAVLYLKGKYFACRKCQNLNYRSSQLSGEGTYYHEQLEKLCRILKTEYEPLTHYPPFKPKNMHWRTYQKHVKRYRYLADKRDQLFLSGAMRILNKSS
jgi:predicted RNA-binding Zn-ribbon protein involved in translation (DUF1610 family)